MEEKALSWDAGKCVETRYIENIITFFFSRRGTSVRKLRHPLLTVSKYVFVICAARHKYHSLWWDLRFTCL